MQSTVRLCRLMLLTLCPALWGTPAHRAAAEEPDPPERPNIVLIISDDQSWTDYGFMGHEVIETPALDRLAEQSAVFTRGYVPSSLCRPSLATMVTGLYPHRHGVTGNDPASRQQSRAAYLADNARLIENFSRLPTIPKLLAEQGYVSHQSGKWWEGRWRTGGFTAGMTHGDPARGGRHGDEGLKIGRQGMEPVTDFIDQALEDEQPFFVWYAPFLPHTPHNPPQRLLQKYTADDRPIELARYYAMCEWFDETCGQLLDHLDRREIAERTMVLYVCDNGWIQPTAESELPEGWRQPFAPRSKRAPQDTGIRTPIMVRLPGRVEPGVRKELAGSIDLAPTVLRAAGLEPTAEMPGLDLVRLAAGDGPPRNTLFGDIYDHDIPDIDRPASGLLFRWVIDGEWKLILPTARLAPDSYPWNPEDRRPQLYHITADPFEEENLAEQHPERVEQLTALLDAWWDPQQP